MGFYPVITKYMIFCNFSRSRLHKKCYRNIFEVTFSNQTYFIGEDIAEQPRKERNQSIDNFILLFYY